MKCKMSPIRHTGTKLQYVFLVNEMWPNGSENILIIHHKIYCYWDVCFHRTINISYKIWMRARTLSTVEKWHTEKDVTFSLICSSHILISGTCCWYVTVFWNRNKITKTPSRQTLQKNPAKCRKEIFSTTNFVSQSYVNGTLSCLDLDKSIQLYFFRYFDRLWNLRVIHHNLKWSLE